MSVLRVAAAVLMDNAGRVLLDQRPSGKDLAGQWEFPGGKLESGETTLDALRRELREELAIDAGEVEAVPLIDVPWQHGETALRLVAHRVRRWQGEPRACEGQTLSWVLPQAVDASTLAPADRCILRALRLPTHYPVTPDLASGTDPSVVVALMRMAVARGEHLLQLRLPAWPTHPVRDIAATCLPWLRDAGVALLLNGDIEGARALGIGVHLRAAQLATVSARPLPPGQWVGASCHDADELRRARALGADFAVLSPVKATPTHPRATPLGWARTASLIARTPLPVYALGGVGPDDVACARASGAQGVAGIRAFWPTIAC